jgi:F0F1-type ATP synthase membrane subunit c/vacuolar-type H+-ATPase subunit K
MLDRTLRTLRITHGAMLFSIVLYAVILFVLNPPVKDLPNTFPVIFYFLGVINVGVALFMRSYMLGTAEEKLQMTPEDPAALADLRKAYIVSFAFCESAALFGFVLHFLGASWMHAGALFAIGTVGLLLCWPRRP